MYMHNMQAYNGGNSYSYGNSYNNVPSDSLLHRFLSRSEEVWDEGKQKLNQGIGYVRQEIPRVTNEADQNLSRLGSAVVEGARNVVHHPYRPMSIPPSPGRVVFPAYQGQTATGCLEMGAATDAYSNRQPLGRWSGDYTSPMNGTANVAYGSSQEGCAEPWTSVKSYGTTADNRMQYDTGSWASQGKYNNGNLPSHKIRSLSPTEWARSLMHGTVLSCQDGVCTVVKRRDDIIPRISGIPTASPLVSASTFTFENSNPSQPQQTLNVGRIALLPSEVPRFISSIAEAGPAVTITEPHELWPELDPPIVYVGLRAVMAPMDFADIVFNAWTDAVEAKGGDALMRRA